MSRRCFDSALVVDIEGMKLATCVHVSNKSSETVRNEFMLVVQCPVRYRLLLFEKCSLARGRQGTNYGGKKTSTLWRVKLQYKLNHIIPIVHVCVCVCVYL